MTVFALYLIVYIFFQHIVSCFVIRRFEMIGMQILNGLQVGSIYALVALGYTMVYGIILLLNFAHGDIIMVGAYISWLCLVQ